MVQHRVSTHLGGVEKGWFGYDFVGNVTAHRTEHKPSSGTSLIETITQSYDIWGKPLVTTLMIVASPVFRVDNKNKEKKGSQMPESHFVVKYLSEDAVRSTDKVSVFFDIFGVQFFKGRSQCIHFGNHILY